MGHRLTSRLAKNDGVVTIIVALSLVVFLGITALVVDLGRTKHARQQVQDAVDFGSLSAASYLPVNNAVDADAAKALAAKITTGSAFGLSPAAVTTSFFCVLLVPPNALVGPRPDLGNDLASACGPATTGAWDAAAGWVLSSTGKRMTHPCNPYAGDVCNAIKVQTSQTINYLFAPAIGITSGTTGSVQSVTCFGACKRRGSPLDVAVVIDRTGSMSPQDVVNVKAAAIELLKVYNTTDHRVSLLALPYPQPIDKCKVASPQNYADPRPATWRAVPLSIDYKTVAGAIDPASALVATINCLERATTPTIQVAGNRSPSQAHTNLGDPMAAAGDLLRQDPSARINVPDVIIFMTDGLANQPWLPAGGFSQPCQYAVTRATTVKDQGVDGNGKAEVYTVGYGLDATTRCPDSSGTYKGNAAPYGAKPRGTTALADMATNSTDNDNVVSNNGGCALDENTDGDHYFCTQSDGSGSTLADVFKQIAISSLKTARLIDVD